VTDEAAPRTDGPEAPPLLGRWRNLLLTELGVLVLLFYALTRWAS
jgi:hypothetical protein